MIVLLDSLETYADKLPQIQNIYYLCFGFKDWIPISGMKLMLNMTDDGVVRGMMSIYEKTEHISELYNVCTHPNHRRQGVLTEMIKHLPSKYYYLQVAFSNRIAYHAYLKHFNDFIGIGKLTYGGEISFVLGGENSQVDAQQLEILKRQLDRVSHVAQAIFLRQYIKHFREYSDVYQFILTHYPLVQQTLKLQSHHIRLSKELVHVWSYAGELMKICVDIYYFINNSYENNIDLL